MGKLIERISLDFEEKLYAAAMNPPMDGSSKETMDAYAEKMSRIKTFCSDNYAPAAIRRGAMAKRVSYGVLTEFLAALGMTIRDMYAVVGIELKWPSEMMRELANICDKILTEEENEKLLKIISNLVPDLYFLDDETKYKPTVRVYQWVQLNYPTKEERSSIPNFELLERVWINRKLTSTIETENLPAVSMATGLTLHWILGTDMCVLAEKEKTEEILDGFCLLSDNLKQSIYVAVKEIIAEKKN